VQIETPREPSITRALAESAHETAKTRRDLEIEKAWLEKRFGEIATLIEQSLADMRPDSSFLALGQRIDQFEERFGTMLGAMATRDDVEALKLIQEHINGLAMQLEETHGRLARLDGIEAQLADLIGSLRDGSLGPAAPQPIAADPKQVAEAAAERVARYFADFQQHNAFADTDRIAAEVAERVSGRILHEGLPAPDDGGVTELRHALDAFMLERRHGDEQTASMLDELQQAMIRVLDRIDALETPAEKPASPPPEVARAQVIQAAPELRGAVRAEATPRSRPAASPRPPAAERPDMFADGASEASSPRPSEKKRQDFIEEARRAKQRAAAAAGEEENVHVLRDVAVKIPAERGRTPRPKAAPAAGDLADTPPTILGYSRQKLIVSAFAVVALVAGTSLLLRKPPRTPVPAAAITVPDKNSSAAPAPAPQQSPATERDGTRAPKQQSSLEGRAGSALAKHMRPMPEAAEEEVSFDAIIVPPDSERDEARDTVPGVAVDATNSVSARDLALLRQQQSIASRSSRLGVEAVRATPAALVPESAFPESEGGQPAPAQKSDGARRTNLDMPPITVGPLSLRLAAANGDPSAEFEVGARLAEGKGTEQNFQEALRWYQRSAAKGFAQAQYRLATLFERGLGTKADLERARAWYQRAAEQGNLKAMHNLAVLSAGRAGSSPDYDTAARWFTAAAEHGLADSQFNLAVLHLNGLGVEKDPRLAYKWLAIAARGGDKETIRRRDELRAELTPAELKAAEQQIATWTARPSDKIANDARAAGELWKQRENNAAEAAAEGR
jgi:localization factor PodJL